MGARAPVQIGSVFTAITVIAIATPTFRLNGSQQYNCLVRCVCGTEKIVSEYDLKRQHVKSCGCLTTTFRAPYLTTHGMANTRTYEIWTGMLKRCRIDAAKPHRNYAARGITVCPEWRTFEGFFKDMGEAPQHLTLERLDNSKGYEPGNCAWRTYAQQMRNKRTNVIVTFRGKTMCAADACDLMGISRPTIWKRADRKGVTIQEAIDHYAMHGQRAPRYRRIATAA